MNTEYFNYRTTDEVLRLRELSPFHFKQRPRAPMLLIHGEQDMLPVKATRAYYRRLRDLESQVALKVYAGEGHTISRTENVRNLLLTTLDFFDRHLKEQRAPHASQ